MFDNLKTIAEYPLPPRSRSKTSNKAFSKPVPGRAVSLIRLASYDWGGSKWLDLRRWDRAGDGELYATRRGISLRIDLLDGFLTAMSPILKESNSYANVVISNGDASAGDAPVPQGGELDPTPSEEDVSPSAPEWSIGVSK